MTSISILRTLITFTVLRWRLKSCTTYARMDPTVNMVMVLNLWTTHVIVSGGAGSHGTLVIGAVHHVASHFKQTLLENTENWLRLTFHWQKKNLTWKSVETLTSNFSLSDSLTGKFDSRIDCKLTGRHLCQVSNIFLTIQYIQDYTEHSSVYDCAQSIYTVLSA